MSRYTDWREIGRGGHANVYRAFDTALGRDVAIKLLNEAASRNASLVEGLREEVRISRDLRHPRICPIHDVFIGEQGVGIVMDFIAGTDAKAWLRDHRGNLTATAPERLVFLRRVTETLAFAHRQIGLVHRDIKPANVFLRHGDITEPVIMDFGISLVGGGGDKIGGTPTYMAPEQYHAPADVDARSDLFALGVMAYELFTDEIPPTSLKDVRRTHCAPRPPIDAITPPSRVCPVLPASIDRIVLSMMAYEQAIRPASADDVLGVLESAKLRSVDEALQGLTAAAGIPERVRIEGGEYYLGSPAISPQANEKPYRRVTLSPFLIDIHPVTNAAYAAFARAAGRPPPPLATDPVFGRPDHPVVGVSWHDCRAFARSVGGRLPSEAEWECAARGGQRFAEYPWGNEPPDPTRSNIDMVCQATTPVTAYPSGRNPFGLWDMCGNVWEWTSDAHDTDFYRRMRHGDIDPRNGVETGPRSLRGGSFDSALQAGRCAFRWNMDAAERRRDIGFRIVYDV